MLSLFCRCVPFLLVHVSPVLQRGHPSGMRSSVLASVPRQAEQFPHLTAKSASAAELRDANPAHGRRRHRHDNARKQLTKGRGACSQEEGPAPQEEKDQKDQTREEARRVLSVDGFAVRHTTTTSRSLEETRAFNGSTFFKAGKSC